MALLAQNSDTANRRKPMRGWRVFTGHLNLAWECLARLSALGRWPVRQVLYKQLYFTGLESLGTVALAGLVIGLIVIAQINFLVGRNEILTQQIMIWMLVRELGPLLTAVILVGRSSSAFASELSAMQVNGEIRSLRLMGISPISYLIMPRVLAMTLASIALTFYFQIVAFVTGWLVTAIRMDFLLGSQISYTFELIKLDDFSTSFLKSLIFGILVSVVSSYHGLRKKTAMTEVPQAVSQAVIRSLMAIFVGDGVITVLVVVL